MRQNTQGTFGNLGGSGDPPSLLIRKFTARDSNFWRLFFLQSESLQTQFRGLWMSKPTHLNTHLVSHPQRHFFAFLGLCRQ